MADVTDVAEEEEVRQSTLLSAEFFLFYLQEVLGIITIRRQSAQRSKLSGPLSSLETRMYVGVFAILLGWSHWFVGPNACGRAFQGR